MEEKLNSEYKIVILIRKDLKMSMGKFAVQISHATAKAMMESNKEIVDKWNEGCIKTIILEVPDAYELVDLDYKLDNSELSHYLVADLGVTEFGEPTITCLGILGESELIDNFTSNYKLYEPNKEFLEENYGLEDGTQVQDVMKHIENKRNEKVKE